MTPDDPGPGFRAELNAYLDVIDPEIEGLHTLSAWARFSPEATDLIAKALAQRVARRLLVVDTLSTMDATVVSRTALLADDYPTLPIFDISEVLAAELKKEQAAIAAAIKVFGAPLPASKMTVTLGEAIPK